MNEKPKAVVQYRGWAGHFIGAADCRFRLNTLITCGERRVVVSTVGLYAPTGERKYQTIGWERYFETMAFEAEWNDSAKCWDADVTRSVDFESKWSWSSPDDEMLAQSGHEAVVAELSARMEAEHAGP